MFFLSLLGDFFRYQVDLCTVLIDESITHENMLPQQKKAKRDRDNLVHRASESYYEAFKMAAVNLNPCNAVRLQVAVNYTIFLHEIKNDTLRAVNLMKVT